MTETAQIRSGKNPASDYLVFLGGLLKNPRAVSSPTPSSATLARAIAAEVDPGWSGTLLELGPGTGAITQALIDRGFAPERILAIEYEPILAQAVRRHCPGVRVRCDDAFQFRAIVKEPICAVVSGLPMLNFPQAMRQALLSQALAAAGAKIFVQLTFSFRPPIIPPAGNIAVSGQMVWKNFPPAHIWTYRGRPRA